MLTGRDARWIQAMALVSSWSSSPACSPWLSFLRRRFPEHVRVGGAV